MEETTGSTTQPPQSESGASGKFGRAKDFVNDKYSAAADAMKNTYGQVRDKVQDIDFDDVTHQVREYVRSNPGKALLISVGVGFVIGLLLRRTRDEDDEE